MSELELPVGWRIQQEFRHDAPPPMVEPEWVVYRWTSWYERRWFRKRKVTGWKRTYSSRFRDLAERWVLDTVRALEADR